jgi:hypothetical protein
MVTGAAQTRFPSSRQPGLRENKSEWPVKAAQTSVGPVASMFQNMQRLSSG